eukprot:gb/GECG01013107.1/.p1 GENE.gb/GECG01013107.1/~~gb/GECG01013107.1/.p1  ORF type:complete len:626 (+),score=107.85 gb/GECG01013107.1/:1-1878(+)
MSTSLLSNAALQSHGDQTSASEKELQQRKLDDILGLLQGAGYFRARVPKLDAFDKVIGGLCWCIQNSGSDVDVDIFYDDELSLGNKIKMAERVIEVIRNMGCPHPLQANQIQGKDYNAVYPVVQWTVAKVLENRQQLGHIGRQASLLEFARDFQMKSGTISAEFFSVLAESYLPSKKYKRNTKAWETRTSLSRLHDACLLEYGENPRALSSPFLNASGQSKQAGHKHSNSDFEKNLAAVEKKSSAAAAKQKEEMDKRNEQLLGSMQQGDSGMSAGKVSGKKIGTLLDMQSSEMQQSVANYKESEDQLRAAMDRGDVLANSKIGKFMGSQRKIRNLNSNLNLANLRIEALEETKNTKAADLEELKGQHQDTMNRNDQLVSDTNAIVEKTGNNPNFLKLCSLFRSQESLNREYEAFSANCKRILENLHSEIGKREAGESVDSESVSKQELTAAQEKYSSTLRKYARLRRRCAARNREADHLRRKLDDVPSRQELLQYRRRFVELYEQLGAQLEELRRHNTVYNMLIEKRHFLQKEDSLLESISSQFSQAMQQSQSSRKEFVSRCATLLNGLDESIAEQHENCDLKRHRKDDAASTRNDLLSKQRTYLKVLKKFQQECDRFDKLQQCN